MKVTIVDNFLLEDAIEEAYWRFDSLKKGNIPQSERDSFKMAIRSMLAKFVEPSPPHLPVNLTRKCLY